MSDAAPIWRPAAAAIEGSELTRYQHWLDATQARSFAGYEALWEWSTTELDGFWGSLWEYFDIAASVPYERVLGSRTMPGAEWFPGARLSYAEIPGVSDLCYSESRSINPTSDYASW